MNIKSTSGVSLSANLLSNKNTDSIFIIIHGTRGYKSMEVISSLAQRLYEEGHDTLSINLSYGINNREDKFLSCDIKHQHNEHESINEIVDWHNYLLREGYKNIKLIGHSRGALNVIQSLSFLSNAKSVEAIFLLAPILDTYSGTKKYYEGELGIPYDIIISSDEEYFISDRYSLINFLFCEDVVVSSNTFRSYLDFSKNENKYPFTFNILDLLNNIESNITIISGTDDEIAQDSYKIFNSLEKTNIRTLAIDGGDHFFRDLYLDEVLEVILE